MSNSMPKLIDIFKYYVKEDFRPPENHLHVELDDSDAELQKIVNLHKKDKNNYKVVDVNDDEYIRNKKGKK